MKKAVIFLLASSLLLVSGCTAPEVEEPHDYGLKLLIEWEKFDDVASLTCQTALTASGNQTGMEITHVGARVIYPVDGGVWIQYVEKETAEEVGVITFAIPPTDEAQLYLAAVHIDESEGQNYALKYGLFEDFTIPEDGVLEVRMEDIEWVSSTWHPDGDYVDLEDFEHGLTMDNLTTDNHLCSVCGNQKYYFPIYVLNPFQTAGEHQWGELLIRVMGLSIGSHSSGDYGDEYHGFTVYHCTQDCNAPYGVYRFQPYLSGPHFGLPGDGYYYVLPEVPSYEVHW